MQWRRRHCCTHTAKGFYLLLLLGVLVFLVHQVWLPVLTDLICRKSYPVVYKGGGIHTSKANYSSHQPAWFVIVPQQTLKIDTNISSNEKPGTSSSQGDPRLKTTEAANSSQSKVEDPNDTVTPGPFTYTINEPDKCAKNRSAPFLVLLIATEARQVEVRNAIRQTWGNESVAPALGLIRLFLLGKTDGELGAPQQKMLQAESKRYHDIIQQDFLDSYKNLTIKTLMGMNWVAMHCPLARYVMKTDSDMFVNTHYLIYKLLRPELKPRKKYFTGYNMRGFAPNRNKNSKWYMPPALYPGDKYPTFCSGTGYVFSGDIAVKIYRISRSIPLLQLEDVYVGICLAQLRIEPSPPPNGFLFNHWRVPYSSCKYNHLITSHGFHPNEILKYWHHLQNNRNNACINMAKDKASRAHAKRVNGQKPVN
ncbi:beta-1,3-galactosyltransferase 2 [Melanotaenia boesemani]|uniref:beta-1,3-galactosyltransferase 2 n=1 Tax=Melanotaenia boesemani TaxID=1250792 RepID=UPI001C042C54|nr:beta-1,3-galactosyltransferase 2 [Melanotaenia boesemani]XP_041847438.1 beta-1,3-galactosyltransferase 2 [Melanotaenia boesemani]